MSRTNIAIIAAGFLMVWGTGLRAISIETVPVDNPGNAGQLSGTGAGGYGQNRVCGAVDYAYNIGKYAVTAGQYTAFLNAVAATDTYGLYNASMWTNVYGCKIERYAGSGTPVDPYQYRVASEYANRPVNYVSWGDAARFVNWLHNGQPTGNQVPGTTETGAYTLNGALTNAELLAVSRNANWKWAITSEDEWYKAAYYNPSTDSYYKYPTSSNVIDTSMANYDWSVGHTTDVGAYPYSSPSGTFDQGGNVWEWNESVEVLHDNVYRGIRGGSFFNDDSLAIGLQASTREMNYPANEGAHLGFRVSQVPEPGSALLLLIGCTGMVLRSRRA
ncbi:MAG: formylglycine-generating enzyme family protein [Phycisphaerales bacterium]|nr:formylglycine-generating enzyme family protein [Phycisphaerales bacterium]